MRRIATASSPISSGAARRFPRGFYHRIGYLSFRVFLEKSGVNVGRIVGRRGALKCRLHWELQQSVATRKITAPHGYTTLPDGDEAAFLQSCARRDTYWATVATMERDVLGHGSALSEAAPLGPLDDKPTV